LNTAPPRKAPRVSPIVVLLFVISAIIVGALGSAQMWQSGLSVPPIQYQRVIAIVIVAELLAYFAIMLSQVSAMMPSGRVVIGVLIGVVVRLCQASLAAAVGSPQQAETFLSAFLHYYVSFFPGVLLQIGVTVLLLWLIKGTLRKRPVVLTPPQAMTPKPTDDAPVQPAEPTPKRRGELIAALKRNEDEAEGDEEDAEGPAPEPPTLYPAQAPTPEPVTLTAPEPESEPEPAPPPTEPLEAAPEPPAEDDGAPEPEDAPPPPDEAPIQEPAPPALTSRESILMALSDDEDPAPGETAQTPPAADDEPELPAVLRRPFQPALLSDDDMAPPPEAATPETGDAPAEAEADDDHGLFTYEVAADPAEDEDQPQTAGQPASTLVIEEAVTRACAAIGVRDVAIGEASTGHVIALAPEPESDLPFFVETCEAILLAGDHLCPRLDIGPFARCLMRFDGRYVGALTLRQQAGGLFAVVELPAESDVAMAELALAKVQAALVDGPLPPWPSCPEPDLVPAYPDEDLQGRIAPMLSTVPEATGLIAEASTVLGRQVVVLRSNVGDESAADALAHGFGACEDLCAALGLETCDLVLWVGESGAVACATAQVARQHVIVGLRRPGKPAAGAAKTHLDQILSGLGRVSDGSEPGDN